MPADALAGSPSAAALRSPDATAARDVLLAASAIEKRFGRVPVLSKANLTLRAGEVHGLLGVNGAGKSTLSRIIAGHVARDAGDLSFAGQPLQVTGPRQALDAGLALVMQETSLAPDLSVLENIFLPSFAREGWTRRRGMRRHGALLLERLGQSDAIALDRPARALSSAQRQVVEIAKALALDAKVIILDEPTASLSPTEVERLFAIVRQLRTEGRALVFVSHRLEEVFTLTDRVTILRDGLSVAESVRTDTLDQSDIVRLMVGQEIGAIYAGHRTETAEDRPVVLEVEGLCGPPLVRNTSFRLHQGEILGLAGLVGSGRSEIVETVFGLRRMTAGTLRILGVPYRPDLPQNAIRRGIALVPEDRRRQSIVPDLSVEENLLLGQIGASGRFWFRRKPHRAEMTRIARLLDMPVERLKDKSLLNFSGGMQQKIIIARWLLLAPKILILDEPTKGIDVKARAAVYQFLRKVAETGVSVLLISSDFEELIGMSDRLVVISDGTPIAEVPGHLLDEEQLTLLAAPRTSMAKVQGFLQSLATETDGYVFWGLPAAGHLMGLAEAAGSHKPQAPMRPGTLTDMARCRMAEALAGPRGRFAPLAGEAVAIFDVPNPQGRNDSVLGIVVGEGRRPDPASIATRIHQAFVESPAS